MTIDVYTLIAGNTVALLSYHRCNIVKSLNTQLMLCQQLREKEAECPLEAGRGMKAAAFNLQHGRHRQEKPENM